MKNKRRTHSPEFKAVSLLKCYKGIKPIHEIAADNEVRPVQVSQWKKELQEFLGRGLLTLDGVLDPEERLVRCLGAAQTYLGRGETTREEVVQLANAFEQWVGQKK